MSGFEQAQKSGTLTPGGTSTTFAGTGQPPTGLSSQWANTQVVTHPYKPANERNATDRDNGLRFQTIGQLLTDFNNGQGEMENVTDLQGLLWNGGFYGSHKKITFTPGERDSATYNALSKALKEASRQNEPLATFFEHRAQARVGLGLAGSQSAAAVTSNVVQHRSPADVEAGALAGFQAALGRGPTVQEQQAFLSAYGQQETASQPETAGGGTFDVTDAGNPATAAEAYARKAQPGLTAAHDRVGIFGMMLKSLGVSQ